MQGMDLHDFFNLSMHEWLQANLKSRGDWPCSFGITLSTIWYARNQFIFKGDNTPTQIRVDQIKARSSEVKRTFCLHYLSQPKHLSHDRLIRWIPPEEITMALLSKDSLAILEVVQLCMLNFGVLSEVSRLP
ncbi:hypothetical protein PIB30_019386 [Stylosanthes scabra]|uniref:Uncharacterized protein n=1 Tax=Stylosanthes scabra TaxID=79078 RepID=A0ABU6Z7N5_9FABA|nr:hypothetical protein [Stylosanthes scabra]